ncbi:kinase-like domain-containing protein [Mycena capillaripes]|nr:kinase-like domain-containing protein [Mycena capillaripes]
MLQQELCDLPADFPGHSPMHDLDSTITSISARRRRSSSSSSSSSGSWCTTTVIDIPPPGSTSEWDDLQRGHWVELHHNFATCVLYFLKTHNGALNELAQLTKQWAEWDTLTSLANYHSVVKILFGYLKDLPLIFAPDASSRYSSRAFAIELSDRLSQDISSVLREIETILSDSMTYKHFLTRRGPVAQQLLDLLQDGVVGGQPVAVKSMRQFKEDDVKVSLKKVGREALIWRQLSHPNLLPFLGLYMLDSRLCLISPWMDNGDLKEFLRNSATDIDRVSLIVDVAMGLEYLHKERVVHGDLKAANILVSPSGRACITDFGLSSVVDELSLNLTFSSHIGQAGTLRYQAPELLSNECSNHFGSDVYAFACVCYEILTGKVPFFEVLNEAAIVFKVTVEGARPSRLEVISSVDIWQLLEDCWHRKADRRPVMTAIIQRLTTPPIGVKIEQSRPDWDETYSARFRRSVQEWPLLPSIPEIQRRLPCKSIKVGDALEPDLSSLGTLDLRADNWDTSQHIFWGIEEDVTTRLSLQAGLESVRKRAGGIRNRARPGSDASASSQSPTVTTSGFSSAHSSSISSFASMESEMTEIDESAEEGEEEEVYEVKRAQAHNVEIQKGELLSWPPGGVRLMVAGPITTTLETASSSMAVDLNDFPVVSVDAFKNAEDEIGELVNHPSPLKEHAPLPAPILDGEDLSPNFPFELAPCPSRENSVHRDGTDEASTWMYMLVETN